MLRLLLCCALQGLLLAPLAVDAGFFSSTPTCLKSGAPCTATSVKCCSEGSRRKTLSTACCAVKAGTNNAQGVCRDSSDTAWECVSAKPVNSSDSKITGFDGSSFRFQGKPNQIFNMLSERHHQVNALFSAGGSDANKETAGAYMTAFGIKVKAHSVKIEVLDSGDLQVELNGGLLKMHEDQSALRVTIHDETAPMNKLTLKWELNRRGYGKAVQLRSPMLDLLVFSVLPGSLENGDFGRPAFLNSQMKLLRAPESQLEGVLGRTFRPPRTGGSSGGNVAISSLDFDQDNSPSGWFGSAPGPRPKEDFKVSDLFGDDFPANQFGPLKAEETEVDATKMDRDWFPMEASTEVRWRPAGQGLVMNRSGSLARDPAGGCKFWCDLDYNSKADTPHFDAPLRCGHCGACTWLAR